MSRCAAKTRWRLSERTRTARPLPRSFPRKPKSSSCEQEFGDGITSAIDFEMDITGKSDPKGDRVPIGMSGKFLPFKYYGATSNELLLCG